MTGLIERFSTIFKAKASKIADDLENPQEMLNYSFEKQNELIIKLRQDIAQVVTSKKRLEMQKAKLLANVNTLEDQAKRSLISKREDLTKLALERKNALMVQVKELESQISGIEKDQAKLEDAERRLSTKIQEFKTRKEIIKAEYSAAEAQVKIKENITGLSEEFSDVGNILNRVEEKTENMKAKAQALDEMIDSGTLTDFASSFPSSKDSDIESELNKVSSSQAVEEEIKKMKNDLQTNASNTVEKDSSTIKNVETKTKENITIIRISGGGQYEIDNNLLTQINDIDNKVVNILKNHSNGQSNPEVVKKELKEKLEEIISFIKNNGRPVMETDIVKSNLYIPQPDISVDEAQNVFKDEGIIK
ncbi:PspA/IM30 family protein [Candidatus Nitrosocosmicus sp. R]